MIDFEPLFGPQGTEAGIKLKFHVFPRKGPARWMLETRYRRPWHLKTWPRASARARMINRLVWALSWFGVHLPSQRISLTVADGSPYAQLRKEFHSIGIFLGTPGANRKIVVFAERPGRSVFVKIPLAPESDFLTRNEADALTTLAEDAMLAPMIPKARLVAGHLAIENIERGGVSYGELSAVEVVRVHNLLFERSCICQRMGAIRDGWAAVAVKLKNAAPLVKHPPATAKLIAETRAAAERFLGRFEPCDPVECYMAHGDFTPWNVLITREGSAKVIDWELYGLKPRYFDLVHYFVSSDILVKRLGAGSVLAHLSDIRRWLPKEGSAADSWLKYVGLYFAYQSLYYVSLYERQTDLHTQASWQLAVWRDILISNFIDLNKSTADHEGFPFESKQGSP